MASVIRLKSYKTYLDDGRSSVTYGVEPKGSVAVAVILGYEPAKYANLDEIVNVDEVVLAMARHIRKQRTARKRNK